MVFELVPVLKRMKALYELPRSRKRFDRYLFMLQGNKDQMILPIAGYNPMGKENVLDKVHELLKRGAENLLREEIDLLNNSLDEKDGPRTQVVLNLSDDVGGAWSDYYASDFKNKFDIGPLVNRNFCTPYFWTSESYSVELIRQRSREYLYRTLAWKLYGKPESLFEHFEQEVYVQQKAGWSGDHQKESYTEIEQFLQENANSTEYNLIFNFFYGDQACQSLAYKTYGRKDNEGFNYAIHEAQKRSRVEKAP